MTIRRKVILLYCVVLAPKPVGRRANLSGDELIPLLGGARTGLFVCRPWRARSWSLRGQSGRRPRLAVAQECSDGYYCQPPPHSDDAKGVSPLFGNHEPGLEPSCSTGTEPWTAVRAMRTLT